MVENTTENVSVFDRDKNNVKASSMDGKYQIRMKRNISVVFVII